ERPSVIFRYTACAMHALKTAIERLSSLQSIEQTLEARQLFLELREQLTRGKIRAAEKIGNHWRVPILVKQGILLGFRLGELSSTSAGSGLTFVDKDTLPARKFSVEDGVRIVAGGSSVREGAYVAPSVVCMPPMFINIGAYVDENTMVDSHA